MKKHLEPTVNESLMRFMIPASGLVVAIYLASSEHLVSALIALIISIYIFRKVKRNLLLRNTGYPSNLANYQNCKSAAIINGWSMVSDVEMVRLEFESSSTLGSWGELITIMFTSNGILINSRPSPLKRASITSLGRNRMNEQKVINMLEKNPYVGKKQK
ncbi:hypothetical protein ERW49_09720 [Aliivibrio finisterrensis]|uniref:YcxB family protein n=1 Tax=Aliivibrio finisterrensis TaxID=511998 RepID=A0A4Q5KJF4_9GAMM|nr:MULTISPECIES: hypothetical protein [Aliivibrio]MDD9173871.1 hypothetical protein [Aliivibrio sp. S3TY1]MDD9190948.1 hypothetical protein [Aliivibrio sp. S2TY2]RYU46366.1 hypothetical protein ERW49_09720 [Aliivibrio finisterrensis]